MSRALDALHAEILACRRCADVLPRGPRPVLVPSATARLLIAGQAPGTRVHETGIPWNDPSGDTLRAWLSIDRERFYDARHVAIVPMGFCYPGRGRAGDLPPRPECAATWHTRLMAAMPQIELVLAVGRYAQGWHLGPAQRPTLTETVHAWRSYAPRVFPLPHPSPRNRLWLRRNPWFEAECLPALRERVAALMAQPMRARP